MPDEASSLHLRNAHELFLLIPLKQGFIQDGGERRTSYGSRLRALLGMLFAPTQGTVEKTLMPRASFADELQNLYHFHYGVVDRLQQSHLLLSATFDSSWEAYFRNLVDQVGHILDAVFCHCEGFEGRSCADGYEAFADFIREYQVQAGILYSVTPEMTSDDIRILRSAFRGEPVKTPAPLAKDEANRAEKIWRERYSSEDWQGQKEFTRLRVQSIIQFVETVREARKFFPEHEWIDAELAPGQRARRSARMVYDTAVSKVATSISRADLAEAAKLLSAANDPNNPDLVELREIFKLFSDPPPPAAAPQRQSKFRPEDVQQNIVESSGSNEGLLALVRFPAGRTSELLTELAKRVGDDNEDRQNVHINVALTYGGLRRCGLDQGTLERMPKEFRLGMEKRGGAIGDVGWPNHSEYWHQAGRGDKRVSFASVDLVLLLHKDNTQNGRNLEEVANDVLLGLWRDDSVVVYHEVLKRLDRDHFGFTRPIVENQPELPPRGPIQAPPYTPAFDNQISAGDLFLGHVNSHGEIAGVVPARVDAKARGADAAKAAIQKTSELFHNGTFLVIRKLAQNGPAFGARTAKRSKQSILGQTEPPLHPSQNYDSPPQKATAPIDSHVRRTNPRFQKVPRIMRRSFSYGPSITPEDPSSAAQERGHMFMAYNASIAQQFEVLQRWINGGNSTGLLSRDADPLAAQHLPPSLDDERDPYPVPNVILRWGMYLFVPAKAALGHLADIASLREDMTAEGRAWKPYLIGSEKARLEERGRVLLAQLDAIKTERLARESWKQLFEEQAYEEDARAVWAAIRASNESKNTPYARLFGHREGVAEVLGNDGSKYSVTTYRKRLLETIGDFYLGLDKCPYKAEEPAPVHDHATLAKANPALREMFRGVNIFEVARVHARSFLAAPPIFQGFDQFDLRELARQVVGAISRDYVGLPLAALSQPKGAPVDRTLQKYLDHFIDITRYLSFPHPEPSVVEKAEDAGKALTRDYSATEPASWGGVTAELAQHGYAGGDPAAFRHAVIGANVGFVPPTISMLVGTMGKWIENGDIEHPRVLKDDESLRSSLIRDLAVDGTFTTIFRTAVDEKGNPVKDPYVVVGVQSAYEDDEDNGEVRPVHWLFGGDWDGNPRKKAVAVGTHGCPVASPAVEIMAGALKGLAEHIDEKLRNNPKRAFVRLGPVRYGFQDLERVRPGIDL